MSPSTSGRLAGRTAVITGGSRGIGLAVAARVLAEGGNAVLTGRDPAALDEAASGLGAAGRVLVVAGHAADADRRAETVSRTVSEFGRVDLLVNNAGVNPTYGPLMELDPAAARKIVEVNDIAAVAWTRAVYEAGMREHGGAVVNMSSLGAFRASEGIAFYAASKAMLSALTADLAVELGPGIRVNAVAPAVVTTRFAAELYEGREAEVAGPYPLARLGTPEDVAAAVVFLLSGDASWITGQTLVIDGGLSLRAPAA